MKLGWMVTSGPAKLRAEAMEKLEWIADTYLSVGTPVACAAARLLAAGELVATADPRADGRQPGGGARRARRIGGRHFWRWKAAGTSRCRCRESAAKKIGRLGLLAQESVSDAAGFFLTISNRRRS